MAEQTNETPKAGTYTIEVEGLKCTLRPLDRATFKVVLGKVGSLVKDPDLIGAGQIILNTCWLEGNTELKDDVSPENMQVNVAACMKACEMIEIKEGILKKN